MEALGGTGSIIPVERNSGLPRLVVLLQPLSRSLQAHDPLRLAQRPSVLAFIADPSQNRRTRVAEALRTAYGLTEAETRVLALIAAGNSSAEIRDLLAIEISTVRTHLRRLFQKTEVSRQSELTRLFERIAAITSAEN